MSNAPLHVVAGVLRDAGGRVLLTQIPSGKHLAGAWEFPGGKCEPGEAPQAALRRELHEELGVEIGAVEKLIAVPWRYPGKTILLDTYRVVDFSGVPHGREGQTLRWAAVPDMAGIAMPPADRPVAVALRLPPHYVISSEPAADAAGALSGLRHALDRGERLLQLRSKQLPRTALRELAVQAHEHVAAAGATLLLNGHVDLAAELGLGGVHLPAAELMRHARRPLPDAMLVAASCHDATELAHAAAIGVDFAVLGPVLPTASHPGAAPLGWERFAALCAQVPLPVYALGGLRRDDLPQAIDAGAQGIAGIGAFRAGT